MAQKGDGILDSVRMFFRGLTGTNDFTNKFPDKEREDNKVFAFLSYVIPPIPFLIERNSKYVLFHSNQGMNCFVWLMIMIVSSWIMKVAFNHSPLIDSFMTLIYIFYIGFCLIGVINSLNNMAREIPIISKVNLINMIGHLFGK